MHDSEILTYNELSNLLNRSVSTLRHDVMNNRIPHIKLGCGKSSQVVFRRADIKNWLDSKVIPAKGRLK